MSDILLKVQNAALAYDGRSIFSGLNLTLQQRQWVCLLGPSGIGKSSLLHLIAGLRPHARADAIEFNGQGPVAASVAYMDQRDLLLPWLSVMGNVTLGARLRGQPPDLAQARALLDAVGLSKAAALRPAALSGGMRQRCALARTLMEDRPLVLMDEPFAALDALSRKRLQDLTVKLLAGRTVLMVTHDPMEALRVADHILVMNGQPAQLLAPLSLPAERPRDLARPDIAQAYGQLMALLAKGAAT